MMSVKIMRVKMMTTINSDDGINFMILELLDCDTLNSWEYDFVNNLADSETQFFSNAQEEKLKEIFYEHR